MSAVSKKVTPASIAAPTNAFEPFCSWLAVPGRPRLLQPSPTTGTKRVEGPSRRVSMPSAYAPLLLRPYAVSPVRHVRFPRRRVGGQGYSRSMHPLDTPTHLRRLESPIGRIEVIGNGEAIVSLAIERDGALPWDGVPEQGDAV